MTEAGQEDRDWQRLDKWLWCARFMKTRTDCTRFVGQGFVRINRQPTDKPHARLRVGDVVTLPLRGQVTVARVLALAARRGPASEAKLLYEEIESPSAGEAISCTPADSSAYRRL
jgi:ribosome-associated heat shock protein Hsp15